MAATGQAEYHVFAAFDAGGKPDLDPLGTVTELRDGIWYAGRLLDAPALGSAFGAGGGLQRASELTLRIADGPDGAYRTHATSVPMIGVVVAVTAVMRMREATGETSETTVSQRLTIVGVNLTATEVRLRCQDIEEAKLDTLYPPLTWRTDDWPQLRSDDAGQPICHPVGTALKLPCPQILANAEDSQYVFGVCTSDVTALLITSTNLSLKRVTVSSALTDLIEVGQVVYLAGTAISDGRYTVTAINSSTSFTVAETLFSGGVGGFVRLMPHVLTVYRDGRVVDPGEYQVIHIQARQPLMNGDFATNDLTGWTVNTGGTGSASAATGKAVLIAGGIFNAAQIDQAFAVTKDLWHSVALDVDAAGPAGVEVFGARTASSVDLVPGARRGALLRASSSGAGSLLLRPPDFTGTTVVDNVVLGEVNLVAVLFATPQVDFQGNFYPIEADVRGIASRNAAREVQRLLEAAGLIVDATSFAAAVSHADSNRMLVDCDYGRGGQRTIRAILDEHLFLLRGALARNAAGEYTIWQDLASAPVATFDESQGDSVEVDGVTWDSAPKSVAIRYRPGSRDPGSLQHTIRRDVPFGLLGEQPPRDMRYLRDHEAADRLLSYLADRTRFSARSKATIYRRQFDLSDVITLGSPLHWGSAKLDWIVRAVSRTPNANELELLEYAPAVYTYRPSATLPADSAALPYEPDYSETPPAAPSALTITDAAVALAPDGSSTAWVAVRCTPPSVNWTQVWFSAVHNVTGEILLGQGTDNGFGSLACTLSGLRAGNVYQLKAWAVNAFNVAGVIQATFNATAIGGGAAVSTFTTPGYATLPPNVSSISPAQGTGLMVQVAWPAVSLPIDVLGDYILERSVEFGAFGEVWRGRANGYTDRDFSQYGDHIRYRVKASNRWGSTSAGYATSGTLTLVRNIYGGTGDGADIRDGTVGTVNRTGVTTVSGVYSTAATMNIPPVALVAISHSLGKLPVLGSVVTNKSRHLPRVNSVTTSLIVVQVVGYYVGPVNTANGNISGDAMSGTCAVDFW